MHVHRRGQQNGKVTYPLHNIHASESADEVDCTKDDLRHVRVIEAHRRENRCSVIEEIVGARQLLEGL